MIQFFVNNQELVLQHDFSFNWNQQNPHITDKGDFSLDMTVSLLESMNLKAFKFLNRLNKTDKVITSNARLIDDGKVYHGTIKIQTNTDTSVTFQFLSGNSEFKFLTSNSNKIWALDFGSEISISPEQAYQSLSTVGYTPTNKYVCPPVLCESKVINDYQLTTSINGNYAYIFNFFNVSEQIPLSNAYYTLETAVSAIPVNIRAEAFTLVFYSDKSTLVGYQYKSSNLGDGAWNTTSDSNSVHSDGNWQEFYPKYIFQPYLMHFINSIPVLFGYQLKNNILENDERAKIMYLTNTSLSGKYSDALPDMTVSQFISEVEKFFNVKYEVDATDKSISIVRLENSIDRKKIVKMNPIDTFTEEYDIEILNDRYDFDRVKYNVEETDYFSYQQITDEKLEFINIVEFENIDAIKTYLSSTNGLFNLKIIYRDKSTGNDWFVQPFIDDTVSFKTSFFWIRIIRGSRYYYLALVNKFKPWGSGTDKVQTLSLVPTSMCSRYKYIGYRTTSSALNNIPCFYQMPIASTSLYEPDSAGFKELIENGVTKITRSENIEVCLYTGKCTIAYLPGYNPAVEYPFSHVSLHAEFGYDFAEWYTYFATKITTSMELVGENGVIANYGYQNIIEDITKDYIFQIINNPDLSINNIFEYNNRRYLPISFECDKKNNLKTLVTCKFFRLL